MLRRELLKFGLLAVASRSAFGDAGSQVTADFTVFGRTALFAYHRFEFCNGRNFQLVLRLRSPNPGRRLPFNERFRSAVLRVDSLDIRTLRPGRHDRQRILRGQWTGDREPGLPSNVEVLETLFYSQVLSAQARPLRPEYYTFGAGRETYACHVIEGAPDFDHLVRIAPGGKKLQTQSLDNSLSSTSGIVGSRDVLIARPIESHC